MARLTAAHLALVVDDEPDIRALLEISLQRMGLQTHAVGDIASAKAALGQHRFHLCLTDMRLPDGRGLDLVRHIQHHGLAIPTAVITAYGSLQDAVESLKAGAFDFVSKPIDLAVVQRLVQSALKLDTAPKAEKTDTPTLIGNAPALEQLRQLIGKVARSQAPVYISGESGTGKELIARLIHQQSPRSDHAFVPVNCGAIPRDLLESELFGHVKGSFTGALRDKPGLFQAAHGGSLFLDEIADLPLNMQVKLLRALQERRIRPVGAEHEIDVDVRILCATHQPLAELVTAGNFRQDLYYRINVIELKAPPLRERVEDIPLLAQHILQRLGNTYTLTDAALRALASHAFPGNVRELENLLERAVTLADSDQIDVDNLHLPVANTSSSAAATAPTTEPPFSGAVADTERELIRRALEKTRYNKTKAAELLGMSFRALRYRVKKLGLDGG